METEKIDFSKALPLMTKVVWSENSGWGDIKVAPKEECYLPPYSPAVRFGDAIFEGMKGLKYKNQILGFRIRDHFDRMCVSAKRLVMPLPEVMLMYDSLRLLAIEYKKNCPEGHFIYFCPQLVNASNSLKATAGEEYWFTCWACYLKGVDAPLLKTKIDIENIRAFIDGTGNIKFGGNYAPTKRARAQAEKDGCDSVLFVGDGGIQELQTSNIFFVADNDLYTPALDSGTILPGITRKTILEINTPSASELKLPLRWLLNGLESKRFTEAFATGTAVTMQKILSFYFNGHPYMMPEKTPVFDQIKADMLQVYRGESHKELTTVLV